MWTRRSERKAICSDAAWNGEPRNGHLVDLTLAGTGADVGNETSSARVRLGGTHLTRVTPRTSDGGAAQRLGAHDAAQLTLAHLVVDLREARSRPVVCKRDRKREKLTKCFNSKTQTLSDEDVRLYKKSPKMIAYLLQLSGLVVSLGMFSQ